MKLQLQFMQSQIAIHGVSQFMTQRVNSFNRTALRDIGEKSLFH